MKRRGKPFERRRWYIALMAAVALLTALLTLTRDAGELVKPLLEPTIYSSNIEIVLDTSARMGRPFEGTTKLTVALGAIQNVLATEPLPESTSQPTAVALRGFGGCQSSPLVLDFSPDTVERMPAAVAGLSPAGMADLGYAVNAAMADFSHKRFAGTKRRVVVIAGGADECGSMSASIDGFRQRVETTPDGLVLDFRIIGLGVTASERSSLEDLAASVGGQAKFVEGPDELEAAITLLMVPSDVTAEALVLIDAVNDSATALRKIIDLIGEKNYAAARTNVALAREQHEKSNPVTQTTNTRHDKLFADFEQEVLKGRALQERLLKEAEKMLGEIGSGNIVAYNESAKDYTDVTRDYSEQAKTIDQLAAQLAKSGRP